MDPEYAAHLRELIGRHADELAAVIVEPVVQGAGGMRFHSPGYLRVLREACDEHGVLLVLDEIATGFGRTGSLFAAEHAGCLARRDVPGQGADRRLSDDGRRAVHHARWPTASRRGEVPVLAHGPTFMGNPLAAAVACASLDLLLDQDWAPEVKRIEAGLRERAGAAPPGLPGVRDVRVLGAIGVVQLDHEVDMAAATRAAVRAGVWLRPFRDLVYTMPPYVTGDDDVARICAAVRDAAAAADGAGRRDRRPADDLPGGDELARTPDRHMGGPPRRETELAWPSWSSRNGYRGRQDGRPPPPSPPRRSPGAVAWPCSSRRRPVSAAASRATRRRWRGWPVR